MERVTDFEYLSNLVTIRFRKSYGKYFYLKEPFVVKFKLDGVERVIVCPSGMPSDGPSVPDYVPDWVIHRMDAHLEASVVHDFLCIMKKRSGYSSLEAARIFEAGMVAANVPPSTVSLMFNAVRYFGPQWSKT